MMSGTLKSRVKLSHFGFFMLSASSDQFEINEQQFICFLLLFPDGQTIKNANSSQIRLINEHCKSQLSSLWDTADLPAGTGLLSSADTNREQQHNQCNSVPHRSERSNAILPRAALQPAVVAVGGTEGISVSPFTPGNCGSAPSQTLPLNSRHS